MNVIPAIPPCRAAAWVLDPGSSAGISKQLVADLLLVLQPSLTHSCFSGYSVDDVGSVLWSLASIAGACGWAQEGQQGEDNWGNPGDSISSNDWDSASRSGANTHAGGGWEGRQGVVAAVQAWMTSEEGAAEVEACCSFPQLVSLLWGYAALAGGGGAAALIHMHQPTARGAAAGQGVCTVAASAGAGCGGNGVNGEEVVGAAFDRLVRRTTEVLTSSCGADGEQATAAELADAAWALSVVGRRWVTAKRAAGGVRITGVGTGKLMLARSTCEKPNVRAAFTYQHCMCPGHGSLPPCKLLCAGA